MKDGLELGFKEEESVGIAEGEHLYLHEYVQDKTMMLSVF